MAKTVRDMFQSIAKRYDLANDVLSFGTHRLWRKEALKFADVKEGSQVIDLCTGTGDFAFELAKHVGPNGNVVGIDFVEDMIKLAQEKQKKSEQKNITFFQGDAMDIPLEDNFADVVTVSFGIRNVDDTKECLKEISRVLVPEGKVIILEFGQPTIPVFKQIYNFYSRYIMPLVGAIITGNKRAYEYLPETSRNYPAGSRFTEILSDTGYNTSQMKSLLGGVAYVYTGKNKPLKELSHAA